MRHQLDTKYFQTLFDRFFSEQVLLELEPRFSAGVRDSVSLAWLGGSGDRPTYKGLDFKSFISEITDSHLKLWLAGKNLEMAQFKWIVEGGSLNSIKVQGKGEVVDQETLAQANILKKMKLLLLLAHSMYTLPYCFVS